MKLSKLGEVYELDERREMLASNIRALDNSGEIKVKILGSDIDETIDVNDGGETVLAAVRAYLAGLKTSIEREMVAAGVEIDGEPDA